MAIYAQFDQAGPCLQIASNRGWGDFGRWIESVKSPLANDLFESGSCEDIPALRKELDATLATNPPADGTVSDTAHGIIHAIDAAGKAGIVLITNGVTQE